MQESLSYIYKQQKELAQFSGIAALLGWDQMTYMPAKGIDKRAEQLSLISRLSHERVASDEFYSHIQKLGTVTSQLPQKDQVVVARLTKDVEKARKIPAEFVEKMSKTTTLAYPAWQQAREHNTYAVFAPHLEKIIELAQQYCDYIKKPGHLYNSLLDDYEEGMTVQKLQHEFTVLRNRLTELLQTITDSRAYQQQQPLQLKINTEKQQKICTLLLTHLGLPHDRSRLDVSAHPFTTSLADDDVRITTHYKQDNPLFSLYSTIHEAGHALYELSLPKDEYQDTVISEAPSLGLHESQSRFWENMIARSQPFWNYYAAHLNKSISEQHKEMSPQTWYHAVNQIRPSCIRTEADELTYCLHIILRFELELDLIDGKITVHELPQCWNEKMEHLLGITPKTDTEGVLQDMHWSTGSFGYFPTYAIGTIYASQLYKQLTDEHPLIHEEIEHGTFTTVLQWLHDHVYCYGRKMTAEEIIKNTCGEGLQAEVFLTYLQDKYSKVYSL